MENIKKYKIYKANKENPENEEIIAEFDNFIEAFMVLDFYDRANPNHKIFIKESELELEFKDLN